MIFDLDEIHAKWFPPLTEEQLADLFEMANVYTCIGYDTGCVCGICLKKDWQLEEQHD